MISFVYITCRKDPKLEWFLDSLYNQALAINFDFKLIQVIIVDYNLQYDTNRTDYVSNIVNNRFNYKHVSPKPSAYQGPSRLTSINYFCASVPRNTGVIYADFDYIVFIDDLSVMEINSFKEVVNCAQNNLVVAFAYKKVYELQVNDGNIINKREHPTGIDNRINQNIDSVHQISGSQFYGYSASPKSVLLKVNGYDEICSSIGGEDYNYGLRVQKLQIPIYYNRNVLFYESEENAYQGNVFMRRDSILSEELYRELMLKYNIQHRFDEYGRYDISHLSLDLLTREKYWTEGNNYNLEEICKSKQFPTIFDKSIKTIEGLYVCNL